jgi:hypothetical protein
MKRLVEGNRTARDAIGERFAFDPLHDQIVSARVLFEPMEGRDVPMVQRGKQARLALESGKTLGVV